MKEALIDLDKIIEYLETTTEDSWCTDVLRTKDGRNCLLGHLHDYGGGDAGFGSYVCDMFEEVFATTFMFFSINDGEHPNYPQETPKQRIVAYLKNMRDGKEKTTQDHWKEYDEIIKN